MTWTLKVSASFRDDTNSTQGNRLSSLLKKQGFESVASRKEKHRRVWKKPAIPTQEAARLIEELLHSPMRSNYPVSRIRRVVIHAMPKCDLTRTA